MCKRLLKNIISCGIIIIKEVIIVKYYSVGEFLSLIGEAPQHNVT